MATDKKETVIDTAKAEVKETIDKAEKIVKKAVEKATPAAKKIVKKADGAAKKAVNKAKQVTKAATSPSSKENIILEFDGKAISTTDIVSLVKKNYKDNGGKAAIKSLEIYVKPEDSAAYYVINNKANGDKVNL
ncbi:MAG: hypothetical protein GX896_07960 [Clostridiales bacterium]|nr:hypothetical protein [Clostridiales bacterium]